MQQELPEQEGAFPDQYPKELLPFPSQVLILSPPVSPNPDSHIYVAVTPNS